MAGLGRAWLGFGPGLAWIWTGLGHGWLGAWRGRYGKKEVIHKLLEFGYDSWGKDVTGGKNLVQFTDDLKAEVWRTLK